jgi:hypothetical protein
VSGIVWIISRSRVSKGEDLYCCYWICHVLPGKRLSIVLQEVEIWNISAIQCCICQFIPCQCDISWTYYCYRKSCHPTWYEICCYLKDSTWGHCSSVIIVSSDPIENFLHWEYSSSASVGRWGDTICSGNMSEGQNFRSTWIQNSPPTIVSSVS